MEIFEDPLFQKNQNDGADELELKIVDFWFYII